MDIIVTDLQAKLSAHARWLAGDEDGVLLYLSGANLRGANPRDAELAFSCWPLWCGTKGAVVDARIAAQLAAHFCALTCDDPAYQEAREALLPFARTSHRAKDLGLIEDEEDHHD